MAALQEFLDSAWTRDAAYAVVAILTLVWAVRERRSKWTEQAEWWPPYWVITAALLLTMGVSRAGAIGDWLADVGRAQARTEGWYDARRRVQVIAVASVTVVWLIAVFVSVWRIPPRRRRYLPNVLVLSTLVAFAGIRVISLHHIDALLYRSGVADVRFVSIIELALLALVAATVVAARIPPSLSDGEGRPQLSDGKRRLPAPRLDDSVTSSDAGHFVLPNGEGCSRADRGRTSRRSVPHGRRLR